MFIKNVEDLEIYQKSIQLADEIHKLVECIPFNWKDKDIQQIKSSSSSVPSNIAEGFGRRFYPKLFINFLSIAIGSCDETKHHLKILIIKNFITSEKEIYFYNHYKNLAVKLVNFVNYLRKRHNIK